MNGNPPKLCVQRTPKNQKDSHVSGFVSRKSFESPEKNNTTRFEFIDFSYDDSVVSILVGDKFTYVILIKLNRDYEFIISKLNHYPVTCIKINPIDSLSVAISNKTGVDIYRCENNKFKKTNSNLTKCDKNNLETKYIDMIYVNYNKKTTHLIVLDN